MAVTAAAALVWIFELGPQESFGGLFWDLMMRAVTPWEIEASMGSLPYLLVLLGITLFGIFVLSILISLLSAIIDARVQDVTRGSQPFPFDNHIVILGWSPRLTAIIEELVIANESNKLLRILILSAKPSDELAGLIDTSFTDLKTTKLYFRSRDLCTESSFENANLRMARHILILGDTSDEIEGSRLKIYLSIRRHLATSSTPEEQWPEIIVNVDSKDETDIINVSSAGKAVTVNVSDIPARLIVETVIQPNLPYLAPVWIGGNRFLGLGVSTEGSEIPPNLPNLPDCPEGSGILPDLPDSWKVWSWPSELRHWSGRFGDAAVPSKPSKQSGRSGRNWYISDQIIYLSDSL